MSRQFFGTDGIRGIAGLPPLDAAHAHALGFALGVWSSKQPLAKTMHADHRPEVLIGMDTRESGPFLAAHVAAGLQKAGAHTRFAGTITTPGIAYLARTGPFVAGVMISASHNPFQDNGIKIIGHSGFKLPDESELEIEHLLLEELPKCTSPSGADLTIDRSLDHLYAKHLAQTVSGPLPFRLVVDCAHGAATEIAPTVFNQVGSAVDWIGAAPNGRNINLDCGSLHLDGLRARVLATGADLGVAFDGDADRALFVSHAGKLVDGDMVIYLAGTTLKQQDRLPGNTVITTVMSNLGLERALSDQGIHMVRTPVGDKYVLEEMIRRKAVLGGEQSGHVIFAEHATTGDGLLTALQVLSILRDSGRTLDDWAAHVTSYPQKLVNIRVQRKRPLAELPGVQEEIQAAEDALGSEGRVLVRFSGTEPLARVMIEAATDAAVTHWTGRIADAIRAELGAVV